ncbi:YihY/virulence factor BrkB family protein [Sphingobium sp. CFD-2]|uniref:YihY/virulence factor BrkB family protein n=1 Tax=Sphingobium sp. CFD-2 TaxID=2878542 RepID=UPI00214C2104|nr:YihY/virulence factor BrkB family protein [Sphingobium sp. CFD-2]
MSVSKQGRAARAGGGPGTSGHMQAAAWRAIIRRVWVNSGRHNLGLLSAGVAFYAFLSFVPLLGAVVMIYGLAADPATVTRHMRTILEVVPADAARLIQEQLTQLTTSAQEKKGIGLLIALLVSIFGASRASSAMIGSLNIIYEQQDRRSLLKNIFVAGALAGAAVLVSIIGLAAASMLSVAKGLVAGIGPLGATAVQALTWLIAAALCSVAIGGMYRFAPGRTDVRWQWFSLGSCLATFLWLAATLGFGLYASRFGNYDATYGSLGAVVVLLMWLFVSAYAVLIGALINAEAERQTMCDTSAEAADAGGQRMDGAARRSSNRRMPVDGHLQSSA